MHLASRRRLGSRIPLEAFIGLRETRKTKKRMTKSTCIAIKVELIKNNGKKKKLGFLIMKSIYLLISEATTIHRNNKAVIEPQNLQL